MNEIGKIPPQATDIEEIVLGSLMVESTAYDKVHDLLKKEYFYNHDHQSIFEAIHSLKMKNKPVDMLTVVQELQSTKAENKKDKQEHSNKLEEIGGPASISKLTLKVAGSGHIEFHAGIIKEKFIQREIIRIGYEMAEQSYSTDDIFSIIENNALLLAEIQNDVFKADEPQHISHHLTELSKEVNERIEKYKERGYTGVNTGLGELNRITGGGWQDTDLIIIAARPSMGKTAAALKFARSAAMNGESVAIFSLEMAGKRLSERMCYSVSTLDVDKFKQGNISDEDLDEFVRANDQLNGLPIYISDKSYDSISNIQRKSRKLKASGNLDLIIVDYLQLANLEGTKGRNREQEVSEASRSMKALAMELEVPVILLSQLSRASVQNTDKRPQLHHLRESGAIEQDADIVMFIHRESVYNPDALSEDGDSLDGIMEFIVRKNRNGAIGTIFAKHNESLTSITDMVDDKIEHINEPF